MKPSEIEWSSTIGLGLGRFGAEVHAEVTGRHVPMRWGSDGGTPEEWPEVEITAVYLTDGDGVARIDVTTALTTEQLDALADEGLAEDTTHQAEARADAEEREADLRRDDRRFGHD